MNSLEEVAQLVRGCTDCGLCRGRTNTVPGEGPADAKVMFIGEGPGFQEDRQGRPFVGPAGKFLEELLASAGLSRQQVFIANLVKCRPPENREPLPSEIAACSKYLDRQIELVNPELIVPLGRLSLSRFFPRESITRARGQVRQQDGRRILPIMHPAAALHRPELRTVIMEDFKAIPRVLREPPQVSAAPARADNPPTQQLTLF